MKDAMKKLKKKIVESCGQQVNECGGGYSSYSSGGGCGGYSSRSSSSSGGGCGSSGRVRVSWSGCGGFVSYSSAKKTAENIVKASSKTYSTDVKAIARDIAKDTFELKEKLEIVVLQIQKRTVKLQNPAQKACILDLWNKVVDLVKFIEDVTKTASKSSKLAASVKSAKSAMAVVKNDMKRCSAKTVCKSAYFNTIKLYAAIYTAKSELTPVMMNCAGFRLCKNLLASLKKFNDMVDA